MNAAPTALSSYQLLELMLLAPGIRLLKFTNPPAPQALHRGTVDARLLMRLLDVPELAQQIGLVGKLETEIIKREYFRQIYKFNATRPAPAPGVTNEEDNLVCGLAAWLEKTADAGKDPSCCGFNEATARAIDAKLTSLASAPDVVFVHSGVRAWLKSNLAPYVTACHESKLRGVPAVLCEKMGLASEYAELFLAPAVEAIYAKHKDLAIIGAAMTRAQSGRLMDAKTTVSVDGLTIEDAIRAFDLWLQADPGGRRAAGAASSSSATRAPSGIVACGPAAVDSTRRSADILSAISGIAARCVKDTFFAHLMVQWIRQKARSTAPGRREVTPEVFRLIKAEGSTVGVDHGVRAVMLDLLTQRPDTRAASASGAPVAGVTLNASLLEKQHQPAGTRQIAYLATVYASPRSRTLFDRAVLRALCENIKATMPELCASEDRKLFLLAAVTAHGPRQLSPARASSLTEEIDAHLCNAVHANEARADPPDA